jgi:tRNA A-37 threonylcarbamoyl transferase component Bud32
MVGRYELLQELPAGGMGVVYKARDTSLGRCVALKMLRSGILARVEEVQRFQQEARAVARLKHANIIKIHEIDEHEGRHYFTMDFAEGGSLSQHLARFTGDARAAVALVEKLARAVHHAHENGILHRDLKPANVLLDENGEPLICDFGLAKILDSDVELTHTGQIIGTPAYMAPEQVAGPRDQVAAAADIWALGVLLYQLLTGHRPFSGSTRDEVLHQVRTTDPKSPRTLWPKLDRSLEAITLKCLAKSPGERYPTAAALADDLGRWLRGEPIPVLPPLYQRLTRAARRHPVRSTTVAVFAAVALIAVVILLIWLKGEEKEAPRPDQEQPQVLIDRVGPPLEIRWVIKGQKIEVASAPDKPFSFATRSDLTLLELGARPPWNCYRLQAEVRIDSRERGALGIFFSHRSDEAAGKTYHTLCYLGFFFMDSQRVLPQLGLGGLPESNPNAHVTRACANGPDQEAPARLADSDNWPTLAVDVSPDQVRAFWSDRFLCSLTIQEIDKAAANLFPPTGDGSPWHFDRQGGFGIYLANGRASFRRVSLLPLR